MKCFKNNIRKKKKKNKHAIYFPRNPEVPPAQAVFVFVVLTGAVQSVLLLVPSPHSLQ